MSYIHTEWKTAISFYAYLILLMIVKRGVSSA